MKLWSKEKNWRQLWGPSDGTSTLGEKWTTSSKTIGSKSGNLTNWGRRPSGLQPSSKAARCEQSQAVDLQSEQKNQGEWSSEKFRVCWRRIQLYSRILMNFRVSYHSNICTIKSPSSVGRSPRDWESWRSWVRRRHSYYHQQVTTPVTRSQWLWQGQKVCDKVKKSVTWSRRLWQGQEDCDEVTKTLTRSHRLWQGHRCKKFLVICKSCNDDLCVDV